MRLVRLRQDDREKAGGQSGDPGKERAGVKVNNGGLAVTGCTVMQLTAWACQCGSLGEKRPERPVCTVTGIFTNLIT